MAEKVEITALSLGAGWGSVGLALMIQDCHIPAPPPDLAVFADTQAEPPHVYETLEWLKARVSYPIVIASAGDLWADTWQLIKGQPTKRHPGGQQLPDLPMFGQSGLMKRQCTSIYKVEVVNRAIRQFAEVNPPALQVNQYLGISLDEASRIRQAKQAYITNRYPLVDARISRNDIMAYMAEHYPGAPVGRSACFFCPFHSIGEWREIRRKYPGLYQEALDMDAALKTVKRGPFYLYRGKYGTGLANAMENADRQGMLFPEFDQFQNECEGHCGV